MTICLRSAPSACSTRVWLCTALLVALGTLPGCSARAFNLRDGQALPGYKVQSSRWRAEYAQPQVYWLDDRRIMFLGYPTQRTAEDPAGRYDTAERAIYIWDTLPDSVEKYADAFVIDCYADGYIRWKTPLRKVRYPDSVKGETFEYRYGKLGAEKSLLVEWRPGAPKTPEPDRDTVICETSNQLKPEHGQVDISPLTKHGARNDAVMYSPPDSGSSVRMPFRHAQVLRVRYSTFAEAYLVYGNWVDAGGVGYSAWPKGQSQTIWLLHPGGRTEEIVIPYGVWNGQASNGYLHTRAGIVAWYHGLHRTDPLNPGSSGLYLLDAKGGRRIFAGFTEAWAVSPDGCRIGFVFDPRRGMPPQPPRGMPVLRTIDVCRTK
jgi:hypothetical protein